MGVVILVSIISIPGPVLDTTDSASGIKEYFDIGIDRHYSRRLVHPLWFTFVQLFFSGTIMFLHWLAGMIFVFYFASLVVLLREIIRPGVLWFLRNLNDQNFHPIQDVSTTCIIIIEIIREAIATLFMDGTIL